MWVCVCVHMRERERNIVQTSSAWPLVPCPEHSHQVEINFVLHVPPSTISFLVKIVFADVAYWLCAAHLVSPIPLLQSSIFYTTCSSFSLSCCLSYCNTAVSRNTTHSVRMLIHSLATTIGTITCHAIKYNNNKQISRF